MATWIFSRGYRGPMLVVGTAAEVMAQLRGHGDEPAPFVELTLVHGGTYEPHDPPRTIHVNPFSVDVVQEELRDG